MLLWSAIPVIAMLEKDKKRVEYDLHAIRNWSLALDLKIVALTVVRGVVA